MPPVRRDLSERVGMRARPEIYWFRIYFLMVCSIFINLAVLFHFLFSLRKYFLIHFPLLLADAGQGRGGTFIIRSALQLSQIAG